MNIKMLNVIVSLILVAVYIYFFGYQSVQRYLKKATIITTLQEEESSVVPPSNIIKGYVLQTQNICMQA